jgi:hypothetical protein
VSTREKSERQAFFEESAREKKKGNVADGERERERGEKCKAESSTRLFSDFLFIKKGREQAKKEAK